MKRAFLALLLLICVLLMVTTAAAQTSTTGQIAGVVKDPTGAVVPGAKLTVTSASGEVREATADAEGRYRFPLLTPGSYTLKAEAAGFRAATAANVAVTVTQTTDLEIPLALQTASETMNISAEPPLVDSSNATTGRLVAERQIKQLPLPTRNLQQLLALSPGTVGATANNTEMGRGDVNISVNGQRTTSNNVVMDGVGINSPGTNSTPNISVPSPDAVQEFIVQTSLYDATQGRNSGGNVALVTKSGTSQFHGSAFEFFRNRVLNSNDYFLKAAGIKKPILNRNQFGGTLGGPLIKDKTFFFVSYQGTRERNGASQSNSLSFPFLPAGLTNDRSDAAITSLATAYGAVFVNPITKGMLQAKLPNGNYMIPSAAGGSIASPGLVSSPQSVISRFREDQFNTNIDQVISQKNKLTGKFFFSNTPQYQGIWNFIGSNALQLPGFGGNIEFYNRVLSLSDSHVFSSNLINEARFGYSRIDGPGTPEEPFKNSDFGITNPLCATNPKFCGLATVQVSSMFTVGNYPLSDQRSTTQTYQWGDMVSYTHGRHFLRFGADMRRYLVDFYFNFWSNGQVNFSSFKNFMMGVPDFALLGNGVRSRNYRMMDFETYLQDDIRVTDQFTLNVGMRLARNGGISDTQNSLVNFDQAAFAQNTLPCTAAAPCTKGFNQVAGT
ncbi:MAG: carboxypeptidase regulatory-like domain-containing protein, partial [Terriglobales bacterium]